MVEATRRCRTCGGELRFSHVEYAGRGEQRVVWRCRGCGSTVTGTARPRDDDRARPAARGKPPVNEGPPTNTVLDPEQARRLLSELDDGGG